jgi:hypothetical protein
MYRSASHGSAHSISKLQNNSSGACASRLACPDILTPLIAQGPSLLRLLICIPSVLRRAVPVPSTATLYDCFARNAAAHASVEEWHISPCQPVCTTLTTLA